MRLALFILAILITSPVAHAQSAANKAKAKESYRLASQSYDLGEYRDALTKFKEAYRYFEEPTFLFNIAQCHRQLGERQDAIRFFRTYLIKKPDAPNRADVEQMIARLEAEERNKTTTAPSAPARPASSPPPVAPVAAPPTAPAPAAPATAMPSVTASPSPMKTPLYKKWWLWTIVGVAVAGGAAGLAIGLSQPTTPTATTTFGNTSPF